VIPFLVALFWLAFAAGLFSLHRWGLPLWVRYEMLMLWDYPRALDTFNRMR